MDRPAKKYPPTVPRLALTEDYKSKTQQFHLCINNEAYRVLYINANISREAADFDLPIFQLPTQTQSRPQPQQYQQPPK